jgi:hypothetical protein
MAHARHGDISEIGGPSGAAEHLAHERERHHDENRHAEQRPDHAVDVESEIDLSFPKIRSAHSDGAVRKELAW